MACALPHDLGRSSGDDLGAAVEITAAIGETCKS